MATATMLSSSKRSEDGWEEEERGGGGYTFKGKSNAAVSGVYQYQSCTLQLTWTSIQKVHGAASTPWE